MAAVAVTFLKERADMWAGLISEDIDEGVFSVLNLDHDSFLSGPENNQNESGSPYEEHNLYLSNSCIREHDSFCFSFSDPFYFQSIEDELCSEEILTKTPLEHQLSEKTVSTPAVCTKTLAGYPRQQDDCWDGDRKHVTRRIQEDIKHGKSCTIFRTNINALRHYSNSGKPVDRLSTGAQPSSWTSLQGAVAVLQDAWRRFLFRHVYLHLREVVRAFSLCRASAALKAINPREARLADAASDIVVHFRLAAHAHSALPIVVYKLFTRRPVVDICLRSARNPSSPNTKCSVTHHTLSAGHCLLPSERPAAAGSAGWPGTLPGTLPGSCSKRVEHNDWRPCSVGILFDPDRCPARDQRDKRRALAAVRQVRPARRAPAHRLPCRVKKQSVSAPPPSALPSVKSATSHGDESRERDRKSYLSAKERERSDRLVSFRRMYGYDREPCKGDYYSLSRVSSRSVCQGQPVRQACLGLGSTPSVDRIKERAVPVESCNDTFNWSSYQAGDAYYSRLFSSWGC